MSGSLETTESRLYQYFEQLEDPRSSVNRKHLLVDIVVISICGILSGADGADAIAVWAKARLPWLQQFLKLPCGLPSKDCLRRVLNALNPQGFQACFQAWLESLADSEAHRFLSIDGKTLRRSHNPARGLGALHLVSVWSHAAKLTLAQVATGAKSNEITAIPQLLDMIALKGAVVTIDAIGTQREIASQIIAGGGDYILPTKGNQPTLEAAVRAEFDQVLESETGHRKVSVLETEEQAHGRLEKRTYWLMNVPPTFPKRGEWQGLQTLGMVIRTREINGVETGEVQYYIGSIKRHVQTFATATRGHWGIENTCHWSLDITFREDEKRTRTGHGAENEAWLRRFTLGLLKQHPDQKLSLAMKRRKAGWDETFLTEVVFGVTT
jgi:predicted transposase YbfD/YdcC